MKRKLNVSICIPAYNEGENIAKILGALRSQKTRNIIIKKVVVVSSGSTDNTESTVLTYGRKDPRILLIKEPERRGKASAINAFLRQIKDEVVVIESADTIPKRNTIEKLCRPFLMDKNIGMTGGSPIPVNDPRTFLGYIIHTWWWFHRKIPRFGEIIAFRNVLKTISRTTAVDEAFIQAKLIQRGYKIVHIDDAIVQNKGPESISELIKQRRRIFNGHVRLFAEENVKIDNMTKSSLRLLLFEYEIKNFKHLIWFLGGTALELYARLLGMYDTYFRKINPYIWDTAASTKNLSHDTIVFLNFAPIHFMGGAERWMLDVSSEVGKKKNAVLIDVHPNIADLYGKLVLKQPFSKRLQGALDTGRAKHISLIPLAFVPFSSPWKQVYSIIQNARKIYIRYEFLEVLIILYFGGLSVFNKTTAGMHTTLQYPKPQRLFDHLHNFFYSSRLNKLFLSRMQKIHVLTMKDKRYFTEQLRFSNIVHVPNYAVLTSKRHPDIGKDMAHLHIAVVGSLSRQKGVDMLIETIKDSSADFVFHIAGAGPMEQEVKQLTSRENVNCYGYLGRRELARLYSKCDILFFPSHAESLSLVCLEAMLQGLLIISSPETKMDIPRYIQIVNDENSVQGYLKLFKKFLQVKRRNGLIKQKIKVQTYAKKTFSRDLILTQLFRKVFG